MTNIRLADPTGTEIYCCDLALELQRRGQQVVVYSPVLGPVAERLQSLGVTVTDDLASAPLPDLIHGHHTLETALAIARFPRVPAVFVSHSSTAWFDTAPKLSAIQEYVAVDLAVRDRLVLQDGVDEVTVIGNGIDLERFRARDGLPASPRRALLFSNSAGNSGWAQVVRDACNRAEIPLDVVGLADGITERPEETLLEYDLVFAKARCAMEALATGAAVVICDFAGVGGMITADRVEALRPLNFGLRTMRSRHTPEALDAAIADYDPDDAAMASEVFRREWGLQPMVDALMALHDRAIAKGAPAPTEPDGARLADLFGSASVSRWDLEAARIEISRLSEEVRRGAGFESQVNELRAHAEAQAADAARLSVELGRTRRRLKQAMRRLDEVRGTRTWRLSRKVLRPYAALRRVHRG
jgi:hypothetical protein